MLVVGRDEGAAASSATLPPDGTFWTTATSFPRADATARLVDGDLALSEAKLARGETALLEGEVREVFGPTTCDTCRVGVVVSVVDGFTTTGVFRVRQGVDT